MGRGWMWIAIAALGCRGSAPEPTFGRPADLPALLEGLDRVARTPAHQRHAALAALILEQCGEDCGCLAGAARSLPSTCPAANPQIPPAWPPLEVCGRYLAAQVRRAPREARAALAAKLGALEVRVPRIDPEQFPAAAATHTRPLSSTPAVVGVGEGLVVRLGELPRARFTERGVELIASSPPSPVPLPRLDATLSPICGPRPTHTIPLSSIDPSWSPFDRLFVGAVDAPSAPNQPIVAFAPTALVSSLGVGLDACGGTLAATNGGAIAELPIAFTPAPQQPPPTALVIERFGDRLTILTHEAPVGSWDARQVAPDVLVRTLRSAIATTDILVRVRDTSAAAMMAAIDLALTVRPANIWLMLDEPAPTGGIGLHPRDPSLPTMSDHVTTRGGLDALLVRRYLRRARVKLLYCYEVALLGQPDLEGAAQVEFSVGVDGAVTGALVTDIDTRVSECLERALRELTFPPAARDTTVTGRFTFRPH